jgi:sulfotransferase family protein
VDVSPAELLAPSWQDRVRDAYVWIGRASAGLRLTPGFVMVGASRAGTTSLFRALSAHPQVQRPAVNKGVRYFDLNYDRPFAWYQGHFPLAAAARRRAGGLGEPVAFEASGYYMFHPFAIERLAHVLPGVRIVAMLRDPVERAFSAWKHESARGYEWETFETALELEDDRLKGEVDRMRADPAYESFCHRHHSHRQRGEYADQLERIYACFPREQVHILESERFFAQPETEYSRLIEFLGLQPFAPRQFDQHNSRPSAPMGDAVRRRLERHYEPYNQHLAELLGHRPAWSS